MKGLHRKLPGSTNQSSDRGMTPVMWKEHWRRAVFEEIIPQWIFVGMRHRRHVCWWGRKSLEDIDYFNSLELFEICVYPMCATVVWGLQSEDFFGFASSTLEGWGNRNMIHSLVSRRRVVHPTWDRCKTCMVEQSWSRKDFNICWKNIWTWIVNSCRNTDAVKQLISGDCQRYAFSAFVALPVPSAEGIRRLEWVSWHVPAWLATPRQQLPERVS